LALHNKQADVCVIRKSGNNMVKQALTKCQTSRG